MGKKSILIFGVGELQESLIKRCKLKNLYVVGIDPNPNAVCKEIVDYFEVVSGDNFDYTLALARKLNVSGIITAATDKPLVMMARVADELNLPFFSLETAIISTDKHKMKQKFVEAGLPCAKGFVIDDASDLHNLDISFPIIVKPRDNSGSRGVLYCEDYDSASNAVKEALKFSKKGNVLVEEYIEGAEFSIESIHYDGKDEHHVIQLTEKTTTSLPYNVEIKHIQPANISEQRQEDIRVLITRIAQTLGFKNCASHTEIKINSQGIFIIETSPRLGGDFISSTLVPLSTGVNMEDALIDISINTKGLPENLKPKLNKFSGIMYFRLPNGIIKSIRQIDEIKKIKGFESYKLSLTEGQKISNIENSIDRYGYSIFQANDREGLSLCMQTCNQIIEKEIFIESYE